MSYILKKIKNDKSRCTNCLTVLYYATFEIFAVYLGLSPSGLLLRTQKVLQ